MFLFVYFFILLDLFYDCANFQVNRSISCRDLGGGGGLKGPPPPPPMDSSPQNNPMGLGLKEKLLDMNIPKQQFKKQTQIVNIDV